MIKRLCRFLTHLSYVILGGLAVGAYFMVKAGKDNTSCDVNDGLERRRSSKRKSMKKNSDEEMIESLRLIKEESQVENSSFNTAEDTINPSADNNNNEEDLRDFNNERAACANFLGEEKIIWLNHLIENLWPQISFHVRKTLLQNIQPMVQQMEPAAVLKSFVFKEITISETPFEIQSIEAVEVEANDDDDENLQEKIFLDIKFKMTGKTRIQCQINTKIPIVGVDLGIPFGIEDVHLAGSFRIEFSPIINVPPFFGGLHVLFNGLPELDYNLLGIGNLAEIPGIEGIVRSTIDNVMKNVLIDNPIRVPMISPDLLQDVTNLSLCPMDIMHPMPKGCVFVHIKEGQTLIAKDNKKAFGVKVAEGKSDPYVVLSLKGNDTFTSYYVKESLNPIWNQVCCFTCHTPSLDKIDLQCMDYDKGLMNEDDYLGECEIPLSATYKMGRNAYKSYDLKNVDSGKIFLDMHWVPFVKSAAELTRLEKAAYQISYLSITLESLKNVPETLSDKIYQLLLEIEDPSELFINRKSGALRTMEKMPFESEFLDKFFETRNAINENQVDHSKFEKYNKVPSLSAGQTVVRKILLKDVANLKNSIAEAELSFNIPQSFDDEFSKYFDLEMKVVANGVTYGNVSARVGVRIYRGFKKIVYGAVDEERLSQQKMKPRIKEDKS